MYILEIKIDTDDEIINQYYSALMNKESSDSGVDLVCVTDIDIGNNQIGTLDFKIKCQMKHTESAENNYYPYYLYPRSSISKTPLIMANSVGIIDKDYRGNIMAKVRNIPLKNKDYEKESYFESYHIEKGTRLFQICSPDLSPLKVVVVNELTETSRGKGGFGSTGSNINLK